MIALPITPGLIDETYALLEENLKPYKVYLGTEYLGEQHAAPKIVIAPEQDALSKAKARDVSVNLAEKTETLGVTPLAQRALGLSVYCYGRGPGYTETEALWQAVVSELERSQIAWNPDTAVVRYSTDVPHAIANRVAVFSFETSAVTFDAPQLVVIERIVSDCLGEINETND